MKTDLLYPIIVALVGLITAISLPTWLTIEPSSRATVVASYLQVPGDLIKDMIDDNPQLQSYIDRKGIGWTDFEEKVLKRTLGEHVSWMLVRGAGVTQFTVTNHSSELLNIAIDAPKDTILYEVRGLRPSDDVRLTDKISNLAPNETSKLYAIDLKSSYRGFDVFKIKFHDGTVYYPVVSVRENSDFAKLLGFDPQDHELATVSAFVFSAAMILLFVISVVANIIIRSNRRMSQFVTSNEQYARMAQALSELRKTNPKRMRLVIRELRRKGPIG